MVTNLATTDQRQAAIPSVPQTGTTPAQRKRQEAQESKGVQSPGWWRSGWRMSLVSLFAVGMLNGASLSDGPGHTDALPLSDQALTGTWELQLLAGDRVGPNLSSGVVSQTMTFHNGAVTGETRLRPGTPAATTAMPFPDASVTQIYTNPTSREVTVIWDGSYRLLHDGQIEVKVGIKKYKIGAHYNRATRALEMDHDAILTYQGASCYHLVN